MVSLEFGSWLVKVVLPDHEPRGLPIREVGGAHGRRAKDDYRDALHARCQWMCNDADCNYRYSKRRRRRFSFRQ